MGNAREYKHLFFGYKNGNYKKLRRRISIPLVITRK